MMKKQGPAMSNISWPSSHQITTSFDSYHLTAASARGSKHGMWCVYPCCGGNSRYTSISQHGASQSGAELSLMTVRWDISLVEGRPLNPPAHVHIDRQPPGGALGIISGRYAPPYREMLGWWLLILRWKIWVNECWFNQNHKIMDQRVLI